MGLFLRQNICREISRKITRGKECYNFNYSTTMCNMEEKKRMYVDLKKTIIDVNP